MGFTSYYGKESNLSGIFAESYVRLPNGSSIEWANLSKIGIRGGYRSDAIYHGYLDNVSFTEVPEPTTLSLLALGGLGILAGKKRK